MRRQEVLTRENPVKLHVILGEAALRYPVGGAEVMREQYDRIEELSGRDHITIQVLPFRRSYRSTNDFAILDFGNNLPSRVQTDSASGSVSTSDRPREVDRFTRRFDAMKHQHCHPRTPRTHSADWNESCRTMNPEIAPESAWFKSSYGDPGQNRVEAARLVPAGIAVRDSKNPTGPALLLPAAAWTPFLSHLCETESHR